MVHRDEAGGGPGAETLFEAQGLPWVRETVTAFAYPSPTNSGAANQIRSSTNAESVSHCVIVAHEVTVLWAPPPWDRLLPLVNTYIATSSGSPVPRGRRRSGIEPERQILIPSDHSEIAG